MNDTSAPAGVRRRSPDKCHSIVNINKEYVFFSERLTALVDLYNSTEKEKLHMQVHVNTISGRKQSPAHLRFT